MSGASCIVAWHGCIAFPPSRNFRPLNVCPLCATTQTTAMKIQINNITDETYIYIFIWIPKWNWPRALERRQTTKCKIKKKRFFRLLYHRNNGILVSDFFSVLFTSLYTTFFPYSFEEEFYRHRRWTVWCTSLCCSHSGHRMCANIIKKFRHTRKQTTLEYNPCHHKSEIKFNKLSSLWIVRMCRIRSRVYLSAMALRVVGLSWIRENDAAT